MNTKTKIGIAAAIVLALVVLIVMDQGATTPEQSATPASPRDLATRTIAPALPGASNDPTERILEEWTPASQSQPVRVEPILPTRIKEPAPAVEIKDIPASPKADEYVIQAGDTYEGIARRKYGDPTLWPVIAKANPKVKPYALRVGKKILIPARPQETATPTVQAAPETVQNDPGSYIVKAGDTLTSISKKIYDTVAYSMQIFKANSEKLESPDALRVGMKLNMPRIEPQEASASVVPVADPAPESAMSKTHEVKSGESLWKIAETYRGGRTIHEMMKAIVQANPGKLAEIGTPLRTGWKLAIPE